ncbi:hypothetical protein F0562_022483 [Nyssa sinensis]|uniref:Retrotransposon Copia-like N-terminal domain-containing protein n=1 Tax=Nyssa sinensis TaxID=561372 RepID=A0A5J5BRW2_9ASTE|nr:hypothetical protein F0562_022483 [Nyssa sinensis]
MTSSNSSSFEQYPYPSTLNVANFVSTKLSDSNYGRWKTQMVGLLESQDLLGFIDGTNMAPDKKISVSTTEIENPDYLLWRRTDRLIKGWIIGSLSEEVLDLVVGLNTARDVWAKLENKLVQLQDFLEQVQPERERVQADETEETDLSMYLPLHKAILNDDWKGAQEFFNEHRDRVTAKITPNSYTALHVAVAKGNSNDFVSKLVEMMTREDLALQNNRGNTAFVVAACVGNTQAAEILVDKNSDLPHIQNNFGFLPIHYAAANANKDMLRYLQTVAEKNVRVRPNPFEEECGIQLLIDVIVSGLLDVALDLIHRYPHWATLKLENGDTPLKAIARKASAFLSGSHLNFWERLIYSGIPVKLNNHPDDSNGRGIDSPARSSLALMQKCDWVQLHGGHYFNTAYQKLTLAVCRVSGLLVPSSIKHIQDKKLIHYQALELVKSLCKSIGSRKNRHDSDRSHYEIPVMLAASLGIHEVVEEIVDIFPNAAWSQNEDNHTIFDIAVIQRCEKIFNLIYQMNEHKHYLTTPLLPDKFGNTILHLAGRLAPFHKLNRVSGATLQMQREDDDEKNLDEDDEETMLEDEVVVKEENIHDMMEVSGLARAVKRKAEIMEDWDMVPVAKQTI